MGESVATSLLEKCEDDTHTPKMGTWESSQNFRIRSQGSKHLALGCVLYHWKDIKVQMSKMGLHGHLDMCSTSYDPKNNIGSQSGNLTPDH